MPRTMAQQERSLQDPAVCELLKVRDFLDNVMVRTMVVMWLDIRVAGALTYFADDDGRNEAKSVLESLLRAVPEQSMRLPVSLRGSREPQWTARSVSGGGASENPQVQPLDRADGLSLGGKGKAGGVSVADCRGVPDLGSGQA